ncbi:ABC transporter permease [Ensifer sp. 22460]|uniref:ABC transporter permease n=1 Tax=Ensifer sp. 22460 TaxID=3453922 RepID=UPI003F843DE1
MSLLSTYLRVVGSMIVREMSTRFGHKPGGYVWALLEPIGYIAMMTTIFGALSKTPPLGTNFILFFATGFMGYQLYQSKVAYIGSAVRANKPLLSYPNVAPIDAITARYILQVATTLLVAIIVFSAIFASMALPPRLNWPHLMEAEVAAGTLALGVGMFNSVVFIRYPIYEQIYGIITRPMFLLSGVFFLPDGMMPPYRDFLMYNPICQVIMLFRTGFYPEYRATGLDSTYLFKTAVVVLMIGLTVFTLSRRTLRNDL